MPNQFTVGDNRKPSQIFYDVELDAAELNVYEFRIYHKFAVLAAGQNKTVVATLQEIADSCEVSRPIAVRAMRVLIGRKMINRCGTPGQASCYSLEDKSGWLTKAEWQALEDARKQSEDSEQEKDAAQSADEDDALAGTDDLAPIDSPLVNHRLTPGKPQTHPLVNHRPTPGKPQTHPLVNHRPTPLISHDKERARVLGTKTKKEEKRKDDFSPPTTKPSLPGDCKNPGDALLPQNLKAICDVTATDIMALGFFDCQNLSGLNEKLTLDGETPASIRGFEAWYRRENLNGREGGRISVAAFQRNWGAYKLTLQPPPTPSATTYTDEELGLHFGPEVGETKKEKERGMAIWRLKQARKAQGQEVAA